MSRERSGSAIAVLFEAVCDDVRIGGRSFEGCGSLVESYKSLVGGGIVSQGQDNGWMGFKKDGFFVFLFVVGGGGGGGGRRGLQVAVGM